MWIRSLDGVQGGCAWLISAPGCLGSKLGDWKPGDWDHSSARSFGQHLATDTGYHLGTSVPFLWSRSGFSCMMSGLLRRRTRHGLCSFYDLSLLWSILLSSYSIGYGSHSHTQIHGEGTWTHPGVSVLGPEEQGGGAHIFGKCNFSSSVRVLHLLLMGGPTWSIVISNDGNWRNFLRAGVWPVTIVFFLSFILNILRSSRPAVDLVGGRTLFKSIFLKCCITWS